MKNWPQALSLIALPAIINKVTFDMQVGSLWQAINGHALVSMTDLAGRITYINEPFVRLSGYASDELIGQNHRLVKSSIHDNGFWASLWQTIAGGQVWHGELCNRARDGALYWVNALITPMCDAHGQVEQYLMICNDISALKKAADDHALARALQAANQDLKQRKFYLRTILDNLPFQIWFKDTQGRYQEVNQHVADVFGWAGPEVAIGRSDDELLPASLATTYQRIDTQVMQTRQQYDREEPDRHHPGRWIEVVIKPVFNAVGEVCGTLGMSQDISARKQAQDQLQQRSALLHASLELSPDGFVSFDLRRRVQYANPAFTRMTCITLDQIIDCDEQELAGLLACRCSPGCQFPDFAAMRRSAGSPQRHRLALAPSVWRDVEVLLLQSDSDQVSQIMHLRDIGYETEVERLKSEFMTLAAHELRTPMASIYGFAEILATHELDPASRAEFTNVLHKHAKGTVAMLDDLLDLARLDARRDRDFVFAATPVHALVAAALKEFKLPQGREAPTLKPPLEPAVVQVDGRKMRMAVKNVLSNAYKFSPKGGQVSIDILAPRRLAGTPERVGIRITDVGIGMSLAQQARVFERFYRADSSGNTLGLGLGMSIVHEIILLHGGTVELNSRLGLGCSVTLWLPANSPPQAFAP